MDEPSSAPPWDEFAKQAGDLGVALSADQMESLRRYLALLVDWNQRFNLTAIRDPTEMLVKHFLDSLTPALVLDFAIHKSLVDVGTGAGFPGLVLKIAFPHLEVTLLDAVQKRLNFLSRVAEDLSLIGVQVVHARAEDAAAVGSSSAPPLREEFDVVVARAVARLNVLAEWLLPFARVGGAVVAMKGPEIEEELGEAQPALRLLGGVSTRVQSLVLPKTDVGRSLILIEKQRPTPPEYPRRPGTARKHPL